MPRRMWVAVLMPARKPRAVAILGIYTHREEAQGAFPDADPEGWEHFGTRSVQVDEDGTNLWVMEVPVR